MKKAPAQRQQEILNRVRQGLHDSPAELSDLLGVSIMTIHRDLKRLDEQGYLNKQHGVVTANNQPAYSHSQTLKAQHNTLAKSAIGAFVANHLIDEESDSIIVDSGTTTLAMIKALTDKPINVMVNSLSALNLLSSHRQMQVYALGGRLNSDIMAFEGSMAFDMLGNCHFTKAFLGTEAIDLKTGLTTSNTANAQLMRLMAEQADSVYILCDLSKFNRRALASVMSFEGITGIVTDKGVPEDYREAFTQLNIELFEVEVPEHKTDSY